MNKKVFFVDDEPMVRKAVKLCLSRLSADIHCFSSGESCIEAIENFGCDLLMTDINMPGMSGIELIERVRADNPTLPVIVVTGYGDVPMAVSVMQAGAFDFIEKPLEENKIIEAVSKAIGEHHDETKQQSILTSTERQILSYVISGLTNKQIAEQANRSVRTIENHRHRIGKKLGVSTTAELIHKAILMGIKPIQ